MLTHYPRTEELLYSALHMYNEHGLDQMHTLIADGIIEAFKKVLIQPSFFQSYEECKRIL